MAVNYNKVIIAGNLTRDPEVRSLSNDSAVANLGLAVNRRFRDRGGEYQEETTFVDVECWGRTAELVGQYLTKGRACLVEGRLKLDQWEDKEGNRRSKSSLRTCSSSTTAVAVTVVVPLRHHAKKLQQRHKRQPVALTTNRRSKILGIHLIH